VCECEEGADGVDVDEDKVVFVVGGDAGLCDDGAIVEVVPVLLPVEVVHSDHLLCQIGGNVELLIGFTPVSLTLIKSLVSCDSDSAVGIDHHHELVGGECDADDKGIDENRIVDFSVGGGVISISQSDECVDFGDLCGFGP